MSDTLRPPAAVRITRPYATEDEFLEHELDMFTRTTVTLVGAQSRPQGVVLRFELLLSAGQVVLRGEGRVLAFKPAVHRGLGGLTIRFTRLDTRSKALVDRAAALRDQRRPSVAPASPVPSAPELPAASPVREDAARGPERTSVPPPPAGAVGSAPPRATASSPPPSPPPPPVGVAPGSPDREALLERLRTRAKALDASDVKRILEQRRQRA